MEHPGDSNFCFPLFRQVQVHLPGATDLQSTTMAFVTLTPKRRLIVTIGISFCFFVAEIAVAFKTKSLALFADAFHYMNDLIGFIVALVAIIISERSKSPQDLSFGWQRAQLLGAFFNGVFLLALGVSVFLQSLERFVSLQLVENPKLVMIMGCVGLTLNIISASFLHDHDHGQGHSHSHGEQDHQDLPEEADNDDIPLTAVRAHVQHRHNSAQLKSPGQDLGMVGVLIHVIGDAINNIGVIIAAVVIWKAKYYGRFYADPGVGMGISIMILLSAIPLVKSSGTILLQSAPRGVDLGDVKHDLEQIPGIESVHELHIWRLDQRKAIASAHVVVSGSAVSKFMESARTASQCLHAYGIHSITLQPELANETAISALTMPLEPAKVLPSTSSVVEETAQENMSSALEETAQPTMRKRQAGCQIPCGGLCEDLMCCN
ncbi:cation efflux family protein [Limtongia smithiae]|uniref:cation efflux family protein n=1 Tax=Limtongia smithiae TaxID=1125753 RepID=UPI0034CFE47C